MSDDCLQYGLRQRNAAEVMAVPELLGALGGRGGKRTVRNEDHPPDLEESSRSIRERSQDFVLDGLFDSSLLVNTVLLLIHWRDRDRSSGNGVWPAMARNDLFSLVVEE